MAVKARDEITVAMLTDIANVARYYLVQPSTAQQPAAPTVNPAPAPWTTTEPAYVASSSLWTVDLTVFTDGTFDYSPVSKSSSYVAATQAKNAADAAAQAALGAQGTANSKTLTLTQSTYPTVAQQLSTTEWIDTAARTYAWTGAAGNSFSTESVNGAVIRTNLIKDPTFEAPKNINIVGGGTVSNDSSWSVIGSNSLLLTPTGASSDVYFQFGSYNLIALPLKPGHTYTVSATIRVKAAGSTSADVNGAHNLSIWWHVSGGIYAKVSSPSVPNTTGAVGRVSATATIPANADQVFVRCYHGYADGATQFDAMLLEEGSTLGSYFDGWTTSTPANTRKHWDGTSWVPVLDGTASQALTVANLAQAATQGLVSTGPAPASPAKGMVNFPTNASGNVVGMKYYDGTQWTSYAILSEDLMVVGEDGTIRLKNGVVSAPNLTADVLDVGNLTATGTATLAQAVAQAIWAGIVNAQAANIQDLHATTGAIDSAVIAKLSAQIITSSLLQTAASGQRIAINQGGVHGYDANGNEVTRLSSADGSFQTRGGAYSIQLAGNNVNDDTYGLVPSLLFKRTDGTAMTRDGYLYAETDSIRIKSPIAPVSSGTSTPHTSSAIAVGDTAASLVSTNSDSSKSESSIIARNDGSLLLQGSSIYVRGWPVCGAYAMATLTGSVADEGTYFVTGGSSVVHANYALIVNHGMTLKAVQSVVATNGDYNAQNDGYIAVSDVTLTSFVLHIRNPSVATGAFRIHWMIAGYR